MPTNGILIHPAPGVTWVAFLEGGRVVELWAEPSDAPSRVGGIALARVIAKRPGLDAVIVRLPDGEAFVKDAPNVEEGADLILQVTRDAVGTKRAVARASIELVEGPMVLTPFRPGIGLSSRITGKAKRAAIKTSLQQQVPDDLGILVRGEASAVDPQDLTDVARGLVARWLDIRKTADAKTAPSWLSAPIDLADRARRHAPEADLVEPNATTLNLFTTALEIILDRTVTCPDLGTLTIDPTEAAVMIDVDLQTTVGGKGLVAANTHIVEAVADQLRLRGLRGTILVDFPRMKTPGDRKIIEAAFRAAVASDPSPVNLLGWTPGGMLEIVREGARRPLHEILWATDDRRPAVAFSAWQALAALEAASRRAGEVPARPILEVSEDVANWLAGPGATLVDAVRARLGALTVRGTPTCSRSDYRILSEI
jgi:ribonuclease G